MAEYTAIMGKTMSKSFEVPVNPEVMGWLRTDSGWDISALATKISSDAKTIESWEKGEHKPTLSNLKSLSSIYKRPISAFLLPSPPAKTKLPTDFRKSNKKQDDYSVTSRLAFRRAIHLQTVSKELLENSKLTPEPNLEIAKIEENCKVVARREREYLGIDLNTQKKWKDGNEALKAWKMALEANNIFVFQMKIDEDIGGFSLSENLPFAIVLNSKDAPNRRIFTLFHEYGHLLLRNSGICNPNSESTSDNAVEIWCNRFAGEFLLPDSLISQEPELKSLDSDALQIAKKISEKYKVSGSAILVFALRQNLISSKKYDEVYSKLQELGARKAKFETKPVAIKDAKKLGFGTNPAYRCRSEKGQKFVSLVLDNVNNGAITQSDALDYLSIKLKHLKKLH